MFPERTRRPMQAYRPMQMRRPFQGRQAPAKPSLLAQFQTPDGNLDFERITATAQQMHGIYNQVSPMVKQVSPLITKFIKR